VSWELTILGTSSATPAWERFMTAQVLRTTTQTFLIDCGEGTQYQFRNYKIKTGKLGHILISHLHGDHFYGLMGLISSFQLQGRKEPLHIHAPAGLAEILTVHFRCTQFFPDFPLQFHAIDQANGQVIYDDPQLTVMAFPLRHRVPCFGFRFQEKATLRKLVPEMLPPSFPFHLMHLLKQGEDVVFEDRVYEARRVTLPPRPPKSYVFCTDTAFFEPVIDFAKGADLLYHEATFMEEHAERAFYTAHSTAKQAATIAQRAEVGQLLLGHFSIRYQHLNGLLQEARNVFPASFLAKEGEKWQIGAD
jgi:ribonuclease Z